MVRRIEDLEVPSDLQDALFDRDIQVLTRNGGEIVKITLTLSCGCTLISGTGSGETEALRSIWRRLRRKFDSAVWKKAEDLCLCHQPEMDFSGLAQTEKLSDGWTRATLHCGCGRKIISVEKVTSDEALDEIWPKVKKHLEPDGSASFRCVVCCNADSPRLANHPTRRRFRMTSYHGIGV